MDPVTLTATILSLTTKFFSLSSRCYDLWQKDRQASVTLNAISTKCMAVKGFLDCFKNLLDRPQNTSRITKLELPRWIESVSAVIDGCRIVYEVIEVEFQKIGPIGNKIGKRQRVWLHWNEKNLQDLLHLLGSQTDSLRSLLDALQTALQLQFAADNLCGWHQCEDRHAQLQNRLLQSDSTIQPLLKKRISAHGKVREGWGSDEFDGNVVKRYSDSIRSIRDSIRSASLSSSSIDEKEYEGWDKTSVFSEASSAAPLLPNAAKVGVDDAAVAALTPTTESDLRGEEVEWRHRMEAYEDNNSYSSDDAAEASKSSPETQIRHQPWASVSMVDVWRDLGVDPPEYGSYSNSTETLAKMLEPPPETEIVHQPWASPSTPDAWRGFGAEGDSDSSDGSTKTLTSRPETEIGNRPWASCSVLDVWRDLGVTPPEGTDVEDDSLSSDEDIS
jgi:hypothetical protein